MTHQDATLDLARQLIARTSVSPDDAGCQQLLAQQLESIGFTILQLDFEDVKNLWAFREGGLPGPVFAFAGHTDVVPPGPLESWQTNPFEPVVKAGVLYGRGAADMKGSLAAMVTATSNFVAGNPGFRGTIGFLITSDEEADAINGTVKAIAALEDQGTHIDWCLVGEPSSSEELGDVVRVGRRGSLNGELTVHGIQGHVAYPEDADNPIHRSAAALAEFCDETWDEGNEFFPPTSMQISNIHAGTGVNNVVPGEMQVTFNFRFSTESDEASLKQRTEAILASHGLRFDIDWRLSGQPFLTTGGELIPAVQKALHTRGRACELSTSGGTSDGRFIARYGTQVVELGPCNATIHKLNECVSVSELNLLADVYHDILSELLVS